MPAPRPVTLVHNPDAGDGSSASETLCGWLREAGYAPRLVRKGEDDIAEELAGDPGEIVVVAGGDGTVGRVAFALAGREVPIAVLPLGTANNVARHLGLDADPRRVVAGLRGGRRRRLDLGRASGPDGQRPFLEGVGIGLFARRLEAASRGEEPTDFASRRDELRHDLRVLLATLDRLRPDELTLRLDGVDLSGRYLLVEALNLDAVGPRLSLAPDADPGDGQLDLVLVPAERRRELAEFLRACLAEEAPRAPFPCRRGRRLELDWNGLPVHVDGKLWEPAGASGAAACTLVVELAHGAVCFLVP